MSLPNEVVVSTSKLTALGNSIRSRFGVSGELTLDEMAEKVSYGLPNVYQQVDYVESTGSQYINTGLSGINGVKIDFALTEASNGNGVFGGFYNNTTNRYDIVYWDGLYFSCGNGSDVSALISNPLERKVLTQGIDSNDLVVNETTIKTYPSFTNTSNITFLMFARKDKDWQINYGKCKIYSCQFYKNGEQVGYFIPCYRKSDKVIGMYNIINETFYTNAGSGSFSCYPAPPSN